jgi:hypothetical protein
LRAFFARYRDELRTDSFVSVNQAFRSGRQPSPLARAYSLPTQKTTDLRWFTAAFADCDYYKLDLTLGQAIGWLIDRQEEKKIPPVSMIQRSGRGIWAYWFLKPCATSFSQIPA